MFLLLRILFVTLLLAWAFCLWQEKRSGDPFWPRARGWISRFGLALLLIMVLGLFAERLLG